MLHIDLYIKFGIPFCPPFFLLLLVTWPICGSLTLLSHDPLESFYILFSRFALPLHYGEINLNVIDSRMQSHVSIHVFTNWFLRRYQILGVFLLIQLCIIAAEGLWRSNLSSIASSVHQTSFGTHQISTGYSLHDTFPLPFQYQFICLY